MNEKKDINMYLNSRVKKYAEIKNLDKVDAFNCYVRSPEKCEYEIWNISENNTPEVQYRDVPSFLYKNDYVEDKQYMNNEIEELEDSEGTPWKYLIIDNLKLITN